MHTSDTVQSTPQECQITVHIALSGNQGYGDHYIQEWQSRWRLSTTVFRLIIILGLGRRSSKDAKIHKQEFYNKCSLPKRLDTQTKHYSCETWGFHIGFGSSPVLGTDERTKPTLNDTQLSYAAVLMKWPNFVPLGSVWQCLSPGFLRNGQLKIRINNLYASNNWYINTHMAKIKCVIVNKLVWYISYSELPTTRGFNASAFQLSSITCHWKDTRKPWRTATEWNTLASCLRWC